MPIRTVTLGLGPSPYAASPSFISSSPRSGVSPVNSPPTEFTQPKRSKKRPKPLSQSQSHIQVQQAQSQPQPVPVVSQQQQPAQLVGSPQHQPLTSLTKKSVFNNSAPALPCFPPPQNSDRRQTLGGAESSSPTKGSSSIKVVSPMSPGSQAEKQLSPPSPHSSSSSSMSSSPTCKSDPEMGLEGESGEMNRRRQGKTNLHVHRRHHHHRHHRAAEIPDPSQMPTSSSDNSIVMARAEKEKQNANSRPIRMPSSGARLMSYNNPQQKPRASDDSCFVKDEIFHIC